MLLVYCNLMNSAISGLKTAKLIYFHFLVILMKKRLFLTILIMILLSCLTLASYIQVNADVQKEIIIESSLEIIKQNIAKNEPIILSVKINNIGNQKVYSYLQSEIDGKIHISSIGIISPLEKITKNIAVPSGNLETSGKITSKIISTDFNENITSKEYNFDIFISGSSAQNSKKISVESNNILEIGQLNKINLNIKNELNDLKDIYIYSAKDHGDTEFIKNLEAGSTKDITFSIFIPPKEKDSYSIPFIVYDSKNNILSQSVVNFRAEISSTKIEVKNIASKGKVTSNIINKGDNIGYLTLSTLYFNNFASFSPSNLEEQKLVLFPDETENIDILSEHSNKMKLLFSDFKQLNIYSDTIILDKTPVYISLSVLLIIIFSIYFFKKKLFK